MGGGHIGPHAKYLRISVQIHDRVYWKNLTFPNHKFGKGQYYPITLYYPICLSHFAEKNTIGDGGSTAL